MLKPEFSIGPVTFHVYGLIVAIALYAGYLVAKNRAHFYKISQKHFEDPIILLPLLLAFIFARAYHVVDYFLLYSRNPLQIFNFTAGGIGIIGAIFGIYLGFYIVSKIKNISTLNVFDLVSPSILLGQAIGRVGNYFNQEGFGQPTDLPWKIFISPQNRPLQYQAENYFHPTFFYESLLNLFFFFVLIYISKKLKFQGQAFALYLIFYSATRFATEFFRIDTFMAGGVKIAQLISIITAVFGLIMFFKIRQKISRN